ncbi:hypothetical protein B0T21DRAFT_374564 [Apiosordaria backusii]|uniref:Uncharacterized protein n=1 Tax=Apiosordaria backusii TaxID=314023 RepID=A0AA40ANA8_9PEZI|nr:hypothetical protein B0T21DRAFT_374564 [Apiosordaria backusii]
MSLCPTMWDDGLAMLRDRGAAAGHFINGSTTHSVFLPVYIKAAQPSTLSCLDFFFSAVP